jgi:hypothetical protein
MADWARALSEGLAQGFKAGSGLIDAEIKKEDQRETDSIAADRKLQDAERLLAIQDTMKNRAAERFSGVARQKMGEQVPVGVEPVTSLSSDGARAAGYKDGLVNMNPLDASGRLQAILMDPNATTEQKENAQGMLEQIVQQAKAQRGLNEREAEGKTRPRTRDEAIQAALEDTSINDPAAFVAGHTMFKDDAKEKLEERKLASKEKIEQNRIDQRDRSDDKRFEAMMARIESATGGKAGNKTALVQNAEYLKTLGYSDDKIEKFIFDKKEPSIEELAGKILSSDKLGGMTPVQAADKAIALRNALNKATGASSTTPQNGNRPPLSSFMKGGSGASSRESSGKIKY